MKITWKRIKGTDVESQLKIELSPREAKRYNTEQSIFIICETNITGDNYDKACFEKKPYCTMLYEGSYVDDFTNFDKLVIFYEIKIQPIYEVENKDINDEIHEEFGFLLDEEINEVGYKVEFKVIGRHRDKSV